MHYVVTQPVILLMCLSAPWATCLAGHTDGRQHTKPQAPALPTEPVFESKAEPASTGDVLLEAMVDELQRSMAELRLPDLPGPYFIQFRAQDRVTVGMSSAYGGLLRLNKRHTRRFRSQVRVGSYVLDNTTDGARGLGASLPLDDDYVALRHAMWWATDGSYKLAVEALTRKQTYLKDKKIEDRPDDFSRSDPVVAFEPRAEIDFDAEEWVDHIKRLSAEFCKYPRIQNSSVRLFAGKVDEYTVNSEGTRLRTGDTGIHIRIGAEMQAPEGMPLHDHLEYLQERLQELPSIEEMISDIDGMCAKLIELSEAPIVEQYTGPVLFDPIAAAKVFEALLARGVCARPVPLGGGTSSTVNLEKRIGLRILPRSFQVYDDPRQALFSGSLLAGHYTYDDEAVPATRVDIVKNGVLRNLLAGRTPSRTAGHSTGHGRSVDIGRARASIGCLYINDDNAVPERELKQRLVDAAREEGLKYGLRVESMRSNGYAGLGSPVYAYKVYVEDGREELIRGLDFLPVRTRLLKRILASGEQRRVYNSAAPIVTSIVAPAILVEELELTKLREEYDKLPILKPPAMRDK
ncbi:MAG: metallopeptidase TldD-related protein [Phycisphaerae bacterium]